MLWYATITLLVLLTLFTFSVPEGYFVPMLALMYAWPALLLVTIAWYIVSAIRKRTAVPHRAHVVAMAALLGTAAAIVFELPLLARFAASQPEMSTLVAEAKQDPGLRREQDRIGLWSAERIQGNEGGVRFIVSGTGFLDPGGSAYSANGEPPNLGGEDHYRHLVGGWYVWRESW